MCGGLLKYVAFDVYRHVPHLAPLLYTDTGSFYQTGK